MRQATLEILFFREHGKRRRARLLESPSQRSRLKIWPQQARGRRSLFDFGDDVNLVSRKRAGKVARRIGLLDGNAEHGFGYDALPPRHLGAASVDDPAEDRSRFGFGD